MKIFVILLCVLVCGQGFAQGNLEAFNTSIQILKNENLKTEADIKILEASQRDAITAVKDLERKVAEAKKNNSSASGGFEIWGVRFLGANSNDARNARVNLEMAEGALADMKKTINDKQIQIDKLTKTSEEVVGHIEKAQKNETVVNKAIAEVLKAQGLTIQFSELKRQIGDTDNTLARISDFYDKGTIGAYVKDKIGLLLNSRLLCEANARCKTGDGVREEIQPGRIEEVLFPNTSESTSKRNYYDRANKNNPTKANN